MLKLNNIFDTTTFPIRIWRGLFVLFLLSFSLQIQAQTEKKIVQFTGIITDKDSEYPVPFVSISNLSYHNKFFTGNNQGFFSFVAHVGDTIQLSSVGYKTVQLVIPQVEADKFTAVIKMTPDMISLPAVHLLPWASVEEFNIAFMNLKVASDEFLRAKENLTRENLAEMAKQYPMSPGAMHTFSSNQAHIKLANKATNEKGNNPLLNPFAWGRFINHIKQGKESRSKY